MYATCLSSVPSKLHNHVKSLLFHVIHALIDNVDSLKSVFSALNLKSWALEIRNVECDAKPLKHKFYFQMRQLCWNLPNFHSLLVRASSDSICWSQTIWAQRSECVSAPKAAVCFWVWRYVHRGTPTSRVFYVSCLFLGQTRKIFVFVSSGGGH